MKAPKRTKPKTATTPTTTSTTPAPKTTTPTTTPTSKTSPTIALLPHQQARLDRIVHRMVRLVSTADLPADFSEWQWTGKTQLERLRSHAAVDAQLDHWERSLSTTDVEANK